MRSDKWLALPISAVLSFCIAFAGVMCLQSAFELEADLLRIALNCAALAVLFSVGFTIRWWYASLVPVLAGVIWLWLKGRLLPSVERLLYQISGIYNNAYNCGVLYWGETPPQTGDVTLALCVAGGIVAFVCAWVICRRKLSVLAALTAVLPLATCFVVTDTVPAVKYLYLLLLGNLVLLLTQLTRRKDIRKGNVLTLLVAVPTALAVAVLCWAVPKDTYQGQNRADQILETVQSWVENLGEQDLAGTSTAVKQSVELDRMGRLVQPHTPVMTVSSQRQDRVIYLRQQGFQTYDGTSWRIEYGGDLYAAMNWSELEYAGDVTISTRDAHLVKFTPYYSVGTHLSPYGFTENILKEYTYYFVTRKMPDDAPSHQAVVYDGEFHVELPIGQYPVDAISLPGGTVAWAEDVVAPLIAEQYTVKDRAEAIGAYVRGLARYDKNTARMPAGETDFAKWFVTEADSGYCVHFATTATVLLRAAGIHAQYVEGYVVHTEPGTAVTVYEDQAHAWVEYFDPAVGWRILEATPSEGVPAYIRVPQGQTQNAPQQPQTTPEQNTPQNSPQQQEKPNPIWKGWFWIVGAVAAVLIVLLQWQLRLRYLRQRLCRGTVNQQAVQLWREVTRLAKWRKRRPKPELYALAQKAKFSKHALTDEELTQLRAALDDSRKALKAKVWYWQPIYTLILASY